LHHLPDKARYWSKIAIFFNSLAFGAPVRGSSRNIAIPFGVGNPEWWGYPTVKNFEDMYNRLDSIPAYDRRTDGKNYLEKHLLKMFLIEDEVLMG